MLSAGLDVLVLLNLGRSAMEAVWRDFYELMKALASSPHSHCCCITGHTPAGGTLLALFRDWRVAAEFLETSVNGDCPYRKLDLGKKGEAK